MFYDSKILELDKVLSTLKSFTKTEYAKAIIDDLAFPNSYDDAKKAQDLTKEAYKAIVKNSDIPLSNLVGIKECLNRASHGGILSALELASVVKFLDTTADVIRYQKDLENLDLTLPLIKNMVSNLALPKALKTNITLAITPEGTVLDNASRELFTIRRSLQSLDNRLRSKLNELIQTKNSQLTEALVVQRNGRMCLPVKIEFKNTFKGIVHDISSSQTTCYIEPEETLSISSSIETFKAKEKAEIETILKNLSLLVGSECEILFNNFDILIILDQIFAKAMMGYKNDYFAANIQNERKFNLKKAKHPLIEKDKCVPIDINIGNKYSQIVITGPNTGGKTVALKTVGLLHLMAYYGMMVPASDDSVFGYFDSIYADIGDEQSIEQSLSTFSSHIKRVIEILNNVTFDSLVLLDELGSGTDPKEGSSLAISIISYLKSAGCKSIVTTHYSELKSYAYKEEGICNASVEFNTETLMPTYRLLIGVPGKSNALLIAEKLGLSKKIIDMAKEELEFNKTESSELMGNLEEELTALRAKEDLIAKKLAEQTRLNEDLKREKMDLVRRTDKIIKEAQNKAQAIIDEAKAESEKLIEEIKVMSSESFKQHELIELKTKAKNLNVNKEEEEIFNDELNIGDFVFIKSYESYGTINAIKKGKYCINLGQFTLQFDKSDLVLSAKPTPKKKEKKTTLSGFNAASNASLSCDLRGKRAEEVKGILDDYLDRAVLGNLSVVTIVHGFGTGAVRNAVQDYLKKSKYVASYRYGGEGEGLNGVTVVTLK